MTLLINNLIIDSFVQDKSSSLIKMIEEIFAWLPMASIIDEEIFVVHGGISDKTELEFLKAIDRHKVRLFSSLFTSEKYEIFSIG